MPWQIPATMAYTFFNTEAYSIPVTSLQQELFRYWFLNTEEKARAFSIFRAGQRDVGQPFESDLFGMARTRR